MARSRNPFTRRSRTELLPAFLPDGIHSAETRQEKVKEERPSQHSRLSSFFRPRQSSQPTAGPGRSFLDEPSVINTSPRSTSSGEEAHSMEYEFDEYEWPSERSIAPEFMRLRTSSQPTLMPRSLSDKVSSTQPPAVIPRTLSDKESSRLHDGPRSAPFPEEQPSRWNYPTSHEQPRESKWNQEDRYEWPSERSITPQPSERSVTPQPFRPRTSSQPKVPPRKLSDREQSRLQTIPSPERKSTSGNHHERNDRPAVRGWRPQYAVFPPRTAPPRAMPLTSPPNQARSATPTQQRSTSRADHERSATPTQHRSRSRPDHDRSATPTQHRSRSRPGDDRSATPTQYRSRSRPDHDRSATPTQRRPNSRADQERPASPNAKQFDQLTEILHKARFADLKDPPSTPLPPVSGTPLRVGQLAELERHNLGKPRPLFADSMHSKFSKNRNQEDNGRQLDQQVDQQHDEELDQHLDEQLDEQLHEQLDRQLDEQLDEHIVHLPDERFEQQAAVDESESSNEQSLPAVDLPSRSTSNSSSTSTNSTVATTPEPSSLDVTESDKTRPDSIMMAAAAAGALPPMFFEMQRHSYIPNGGRFHLDLTQTAELAGVMEDDEEEEGEAEPELESELEPELEAEPEPEPEIAVQFVGHAPKDSLSSLSQYTDTWSEADMEEDTRSPITPIPDYDGLMRDLLVDLHALKPDESVSRVPRWAEAVLDWRTAAHNDE